MNLGRLKVESGTLITFPTFLLLKNLESKLCESDPRSEVGSAVIPPVLPLGRSQGTDLNASRDQLLFLLHQTPFWVSKGGYASRWIKWIAKFSRWRLDEERGWWRNILSHFTSTRKSPPGSLVSETAKSNALCGSSIAPRPQKPFSPRFPSPANAALGAHFPSTSSDCPVLCSWPQGPRNLVSPSPF